MPAEALQAVPAEPRSAGLPVHQANAGVDLVEVHHIHPPVDAVLAAIEQVAPEHRAVHARRVDRFGFPVVPADTCRAAVDVSAHLAGQVLAGVAVVDTGSKSDKRDGEQNAVATVMRPGDCLGCAVLRRGPHAVDGGSQFVRPLLGHRHRGDELDLPIPPHRNEPSRSFPVSVNKRPDDPREERGQPALRRLPGKRQVQPVDTEVRVVRRGRHVDIARRRYRDLERT